MSLVFECFWDENQPAGVGEPGELLPSSTGKLSHDSGESVLALLEAKDQGPERRSRLLAFINVDIAAAFG